jgi:hypothetical protein
LRFNPVPAQHCFDDLPNDRSGLPRIVTAIAYTRPAEGLTIMTNIVDYDLNAIRIGQSVRVVVKATGGEPPVPMFAPAA